MGVLGCEGNIAAAGTTLLPMEKMKSLVFILVIENSVLSIIYSEKGLYGIREPPPLFPSNERQCVNVSTAPGVKLNGREKGVCHVTSEITP